MFEKFNETSAGWFNAIFTVVRHAGETMKNVQVNLLIDRHRFSKNARIHGKVDGKPMDLTVRKGPQEGDSYITGEYDGGITTLRINSGIAESGHAVFGRLGGTQVKGNWSESNSEGDVSFKLNKAELNVDRQPEEEAIETKGTRISSQSKITNSEGDEEFAILADGQRISMKVDRKEGGDIEIRGRSGGGQFRLQMKARGQDNDLQVDGKIPETLSLMPLMWELYGDDSLKTPEKPFTLGAAASVGAFWQTQIRPS